MVCENGKDVLLYFEWWADTKNFGIITVGMRTIYQLDVYLNLMLKLFTMFLTETFFS